MEVPLRIAYHGLTASDALSELIRKEADKLEEFFDRIISCRVSVEQTQRHARHGNPFRVCIDVAVPGNELHIDTARGLRGAVAGDEEILKRRKSDEVDAIYKDPMLTVRDAFRRARRRIQDYVRRPIGSRTRSSVR